ncbi:DNA polymerase I [Candidatus Viridilinea mediisalina]|uniref:DNA polymerase I n=1 Tax=Candidatus Viridilinea mediisalina TaxID=2024553 RepID=A0A2A6RPS2_9CHLR|nr:DNA polymerase I [Candidatus Viridilinea mediisalina]PDW04925.1 DNA polymerase I [Candidatus Viridilinea mediisalina]
MPQPPVLALIDGHALAYRAFHAMRETGLRTSGGEPTFAVFGFAQIVLSMIQEQQPSHVAIAFDVGRTFRDELYAEYKAGRAETPEEFYPQLERMKEFMTKLEIPIYTAPNYEADDVLGTLARQASAAGVQTIILTGDTDTLQLVDANVRVLLANPYARGNKSTTLYDEAAVRERYAGLQPGQLADLRGLKGDSSDNIPGVKGIGEKGAVTLLNQFGDLATLFAQLDQAPKRYQKLLEGQWEAAQFSKRLATIDCHAPVQLDLAACALGAYDRGAVIALFQELEIGASSNLIKKLPPLPSDLPPAPSASLQTSLFAAPSSGPVALPTGTQQLSLFEQAGSSVQAGELAKSALGAYSAVTTREQLEDLVAALEAAPILAFDVESSGLRPFESDLVGIAFAAQPGRAYYLPLGHQQGPQLPREEALAALQPIFANGQQPKVAHNAKFDLELLLNAGIVVQGLHFDTMLAAALLGRARLGLKELAFYSLKLPEPPPAIETLLGKGSKQISFDHVPIEQATPYAAADADMTLRLHAIFAAELGANERLAELFHQLEMPLIEVLVAMEQAGIGLDLAYLAKLGTDLAARIADYEQQIYAHVGNKFNINSSDQLSEVLFEQLGISAEGVGRTAKTKKYSLTADTLEQLRDRHPIFGQILHYRQLSKLKSTYVDALPNLVNRRSGRVHTSYNQVGAATGRLSSNDPNLQNIPVRSEEGRAIRRAFVAPAGQHFIAADYSQIELRILAHYTQDPALMTTFTSGRDIHAATAAHLFGVHADQVDKQQRRMAKTVIFGIIYGMSAFGLAQRLDIDRSMAQALIDGVFHSFPGIKGYVDQTLARARREGFVTTLFGRQRQFPELQGNAKGPRVQAAMREAINAPIQGTAADIMKIAMIRLQHRLAEEKLKTRLLLQIHDELILEAPTAELEVATQLVRDAMEGAYQLDVPLTVEVEVGSNLDFGG